MIWQDSPFSPMVQQWRGARTPLSGPDPGGKEGQSDALHSGSHMEGCNLPGSRWHVSAKAGVPRWLQAGAWECNGQDGMLQAPS